jgi:hypothetical protein
LPEEGQEGEEEEEEEFTVEKFAALLACSVQENQQRNSSWESMDFQTLNFSVLSGLVLSFCWLPTKP